MSNPLRPLLPCPPGQRGLAASNPKLPKRAVTKVACTSCQQRKYKCDGSRPICKACGEKSLSCHYDLAEGQERPSLKRKNLDLQRDLGSFLELLWHIQHGPEADSNALFSRIRNGEDPSSIVESLNVLSLDTKSSMHADPSTLGPLSSTAEPILEVSSYSSAISTKGPLSHKSVEKGRDSWKNIDPPCVGNLSEDGATQLPSIRNIFTPGSSLANPGMSDLTMMLCCLRSQHRTLKQGFSVFLQCTASIFHIFSQEEADRLLDNAWEEEQSLSLSTVCVTCAIAAIGCRYSPSHIPPDRAVPYFNVAKGLLDHCIDQTPLHAIKVCALLAMYKFVSQTTTAFVYVEMGLGVARIQGLLQRECRSDLDPILSEDSKKACRCLQFCESWLQASLSLASMETNALVPTKERSTIDHLEAIGNNDFRREASALIMITVGIFRSVLNSDFSIHVSNAIRAPLHKWHQDMPTQFQLQGIAAQTDPSFRLCQLYLHSFRLGGEMLLYRWILTWISEFMTSEEIITEDIRTEAVLRAEEGVSAAKKSAELLHFIYVEGSAVKHFWLCMQVPILFGRASLTSSSFQAYISCSILLHDVIQRILCRQCINDYAHILDLASRCLEVLCWSSRLASRAFQYYGLLEPIYNLVKKTIAQSPNHSLGSANQLYNFESIKGTTDLHNAARNLMFTLSLSFKIGPRHSRSYVAFSVIAGSFPHVPEEVGLGIHIYGALEFAATIAMDDNEDN